MILYASSLATCKLQPSRSNSFNKKTISTYRICLGTLAFTLLSRPSRSFVNPSLPPPPPPPPSLPNCQLPFLHGILSDHSYCAITPSFGCVLACFDFIGEI
jgi:hypothetical protein